MSNSCTASGCNYPQGECLGACSVAAPVSSLAARLETAHKGKTIKEIWPSGHGLEIVFNDDSSLTILPPFAFKSAPAASIRRLK